MHIPHKQLSDASVIVIGNGASLLGRGNGPLIDTFDVVVRFNMFKVEGFSQDVGAKTTVWFSNRDAEPGAIKRMVATHVFACIYVHSWINPERAAESYRNELQKLSRTTPVLPVPPDVVAEMAGYLGVSYVMFSTGAIGVWIMLQHFKVITIVGFDWWNEFHRFHYCDEQTFVYNAQRGHQPQIELTLFEKLKNEQRLIFL